MNKFRTLDLLPLPRFSDPTLTVVAARSKWNETLKIVDNMRNASMTLGSALHQSLDNLRFHVFTGIRALQGFFELGGSGLDTVTSVEGYTTILGLFEKELAKAKKLWTLWKAETSGQKQLSGYGISQEELAKELLEFSKPKGESKLFLGLMVAAGIAITVYAARAK